MADDLHYELTDEAHPDRTELRRIRATRDLPHHGVKAGDLGGFIESTSCLRGEAWVAEEAIVHSPAVVEGRALVSGNAFVYQDSRVYGAAVVTGKGHVGGHAKVGQSAMIYDHAGVYGNAMVGGEAQVYGHARVTEQGVVLGRARIFDSAKIKEAVVSDDAWVYGRTELIRGEFVGGNARIAGYEDVHVYSPGPRIDQPMTLHRTAEGHAVTTSTPWRTSTLENLGEEIERRSRYWPADESQRTRMRTSYDHLLKEWGKIVEHWTRHSGDQAQMDSTEAALGAVLLERVRQHRKWGRQQLNHGTGPEEGFLGGGRVPYGRLAERARDITDEAMESGTATWADVLLEEVFEALSETDPAKLRTELIQVAAVATQWIEAVDRQGASADWTEALTKAMREEPVNGSAAEENRR